MTTEELIAEITSGGFSQYEEAGLIDHISLRTWIKSELKRFGNNIMNLNDAVIQIKDKRGKLPYNFWNLNVAVKCEPANVEIEDPEGVLQSSLFFMERLEGEAVWDNASDSFIASPQKFIKEEYYFKGAKAVFNYYKPTYLRLMKGFNRSLCSSSCPNLKGITSNLNPYEINIVGDFVNTNFREGTIYLQFHGLELDDNGDLMIPETQHDRLREYLMYYCRMRILEDLVAGDDDVNKINLLSYYNQKTRDNFRLAMTETKMEALGKNWIRNVRNKQRKETLKYEALLPTI